MDDTAFAAIIATPVGRLGIRLAGERVAGVDWLAPNIPTIAPQSDLARVAVEQLYAYFVDPVHHQFELPLAPSATPFQARVRAALQAIPPGQVKSYGQLAHELGSSARAIGGACRANPVPVVVPCHRVVATRGLGGFGGATAGERLVVKRQLLEHEGVACASIT